jgi:hypothetical protein
MRFFVVLEYLFQSFTDVNSQLHRNALGTFFDVGQRTLQQKPVWCFFKSFPWRLA